jgi:hypothetical protein
MKLLTEYTEFADLEILKENTEVGHKPIYRIKGPFAQAEVKNRNGRKYSYQTFLREVNNFQDKIIKKRALGTLDHGNSPTVLLNEVSHLIESLQMIGNDAIGIARILNTPRGLIAQTLIDEGIILGVSTRGVGTLSGENVNDDYKMITVDIVSDPSSPNAFVDGILENKDYFITESGIIMERAIETLQTKVDKNANSKEVSKYLVEFFKEISKNV